MGSSTRILALALLLLANSRVALAQLAQNLMAGNAKAISLGNAVTADPPGIDSIHFNPAGLSRLKGRTRQLKLVLADVKIEGSFTSNPKYDCYFDEECASGLGIRAFKNDPMRNSKSELDSLAVYVPGNGVTAIPFPIAPLGGVSYQPPAGRLTFGTAVYAPLAGGFIRDGDDTGRFYGRKVGLARLTYFSPTVAWAFSEELQFGFGVGFSYFGAGLTLDYRAANKFVGLLSSLIEGQINEFPDDPLSQAFKNGGISPFESVFTLEADLVDSFSTSANVGVLWEPTAWLTLGMLYQSETHDRLKGDFAVTLSEDVLNLVQGISMGNAPAALNLLGIDEKTGQVATKGHLDLSLPQHLSVGASIQVTPSTKFNIDWKWTETSAWKELAFYADENLPLLQLLQLLGIEGIQANGLTFPRGYQDASNFAFGIQYDLTETLALRGGYEPRKSGIPKDKRDFLIPLGDFDLYGVGVELKTSVSETWDLALAYAKSDQKIPAGTSTNGNSDRPNNFLYNPSAGLDVRTTFQAIMLEISYTSTF